MSCRPTSEFKGNTLSAFVRVEGSGHEHARWQRVTHGGDRSHGTTIAAESKSANKGVLMPILMLVLVALGAFLAIGILLGSAVILEHRNKNKA
jgi:hypothetical protein